ncbi:transglycosylase SLT domain-containing protein [Halobacillus locisalis]|uniref:Transglycosylase SLT domain-containing protein n=1 Tax=Halobacillus locisalis TaxID=220753 RepID=A0A838CS60_9BACI|nr:transglycosylase SLT domain-containing protein [Halobacillus locisalis]MBA2174708.1 transglycosylase SLT domain-containing protein [Halobacillus locisalis]
MKKLLQVFSLLFLTGLLFTTPVLAENSDANENLTKNEVKELIVKVAREYEIPPEVLIAIAFEESKFEQFNDKGEPLQSGDNGYGVMQITDEVDNLEEIKYDTEANIRAGAEKLLEKWNWQINPNIDILPDVVETIDSKNNRNIIEHWYFAIMAYNGLVEVNVPKEKNIGVELDTEDMTYQDRVFDHIEEYGELELADTEFIKGIAYEVINDESGQVKFKENALTFEEEGTYSHMNFKNGDKVYVINENYPKYMFGFKYDTKDISSRSEIPYYTTFEITDDSLFFKPSNTLYSHYRYYEVEREGMTGYIASSNLELVSNNDTSFSDSNTLTDSSSPKKVNPDKTFTVTLEPSEINKTSINNRNIYIVREDGLGVEVELDFDQDSDKVKVDPVKDLQSGQTYSLYVKDVSSDAGVMTTPIQHTFTVQ